MPIGCPGKLPPRRLTTGLGHAREPKINSIGQHRREESLPVFGRRLGAQMQESIPQIRPLIDLGEQLGNLDVRHQRICLFGEEFRRFRGVLTQRGDAQIPAGERHVGQCVVPCFGRNRCQVVFEPLLAIGQIGRQMRVNVEGKRLFLHRAEGRRPLHPQSAEARR